jgi:hypothetical protein
MVEEITTALAQPQLLATDRCDRCGSQAQVRATMLTGMLLFCGHHARRHSSVLSSQAATIYDPNDSMVSYAYLLTGVIKPT